MRRTAPIPLLFLIAALGAAACARAQASTLHDAMKEEPAMVTEDPAAPIPAPKLDAQAALSKVLELIRTSKGIDDFTAERISAVTGLEMIPDGPDGFGASEQLDADWFYYFAMDRKTVSGPQFIFEFKPANPGKLPSAASICSMDFTGFSSEMERIGFAPGIRYGEHGMILSHQFDSDRMLVDVYTQALARQGPTGPTGECIRMVIIN
jgi:hypothetical protein